MDIVCVCCYFQTEKCFCVKGDKGPSISEANESDGQRSDKVCACLYVCVYMLCSFDFVRIRGVSVARKKRIRLVIVLAVRSLRYVEC